MQICFAAVDQTGKGFSIATIPAPLVALTGWGCNEAFLIQTEVPSKVLLDFNSVRLAANIKEMTATV